MIKGSLLSYTLLKFLKIKNIKSLYENKTKRFFCKQKMQKSEDSLVTIAEAETDVDWNIDIDKTKADYISILQESRDDHSDFAKYLEPTFNFAPYVNKSEVLQSMVKLGVDLSKIEKKFGVIETVLRMEFDRDVKKHIFFLTDYVDPNNLGIFLTKNIFIFKESIEDLQTRINYLESKKFSKEMISRIVTLNPYWLNFSTLRIDRRLGHFQKIFELNGDEVRKLCVLQPRLITYNMHFIKVNTFVIKEELGFNSKEVKKLLLHKPRLWMICQTSLIKRFDYVHNKMKIPHNTICAMPHILLCRKFKIEHRHKFLQKLGKDQFDFTKPNYVSLVSLVAGNDAEFCFNVAKCPVSDFNLFLKTL